MRQSFFCVCVLCGIRKKTVKLPKKDTFVWHTQNKPNWQNITYTFLQLFYDKSITDESYYSWNSICSWYFVVELSGYGIFVIPNNKHRDDTIRRKQTINNTESRTAKQSQTKSTTTTTPPPLATTKKNTQQWPICISAASKGKSNLHDQNCLISPSTPLSIKWTERFCCACAKKNWH